MEICLPSKLYNAFLSGLNRVTSMRLIFLLILFVGVPLAAAQNGTLTRRSVDPAVEAKVHEEALRIKCAGAKPCSPGLVLPVWQPQVSYANC